MTNKELLTAELLDIVFDGRNKEYGAYALRKNYDRRMKLALTIGLLAVIMIVLLCSFSSRRKGKVIFPRDPYDSVRLIEITSDPKLPIPKKPLATPTAPKPPVAMIKNTVYKIVQDDLAQHAIIPPNSDLNDKQTGSQDLDGDLLNGSPTSTNSGAGDGKDITATPPAIPELPLLADAAPQFPGGMDGLKAFLSKYLTNPEELGEGESRIVKVRFKVDEQGLVSFTEIINSGGAAFDREVLRVCKKMPKWKPAIQRGRPASMTYVLPVTFITNEP